MAESLEAVYIYIYIYRKFQRKYNKKIKQNKSKAQVILL